MDKRGATKGEHRSPRTEFEKGKHYSRKTEFKKGQKPHNFVGEVGLPHNDPNYHKQWRALNRDRWNSYSHKWTGKLRRAAFDHYGWKCACCGEDTPEFLTIDHIDGNGSEHRRTFDGPIYRILKKENYPEGYQTLCWNCNAAKSIKGGCPHRRKETLGEPFARKNYRGYPTVCFENEQSGKDYCEFWRYEDDLSRTPEENDGYGFERPCQKCHLTSKYNGPDACLVRFKGVFSACCGHGIGKASVVFNDGTKLDGEEAEEYFDRKAPNWRNPSEK